MYTHGRKAGTTVATWLVTGASSGLGRGIATAALERGEQVAVTARDSARVRGFEDAYPGRALALRLDLSDRAGMKEAVRAVEGRFGGVDVLVNNAGHGYRAAIEESDPGQVAELFAANFFGPMDLARLVLPGMRARRRGTVVNVTSIGAVRGALGNGYYSAAKGALELASEALAKEVAHLGICVLIVEPGALRTGFYGDRLAAAAVTLADYDVLADRYRKTDATDSGDQPGDPVRAGAAVVATVLGDNGPLPQRLLLGSDAAAAATATLEGRLAELRAWATVSAQADYPADRPING